MIKKVILITAIVWSCINTASINAQQAATTAQKTIALQHGAHGVGRRRDAAMEKWRAYGLGQFVHWGLYSIPAGEWNGKQYNGAAEWIKSWKEVPATTYDSLMYQFNPTKFNAESWAATAKQMGVKYVTITTKHHDGFCLWPSKYTNFTVANSPYKKDIIGPLVKAYDRRGIDVILYFSIMDWHNPDWRYDIKTREDSVAFDRFKQFTRNQLLELLTLYPAAKGLWFDGTWDKSWVKQAAFADSLEKEMRAMRPGLIIGSRFRADEYGKRHFDSNGNMMGDYEQGWERKIPEKITDVHGNDWDCVMTVPENQWGYSKIWKGHIKTTDELLEMLAKCVSLDGNFVLNFGPKPDGTLRTEELDLAKGIGAWMDTNSEAIYNGEYAGLVKQDWGYYVKKTGTNKIYMLVFNVPVSGALNVVLPSRTAISKVYDLGGPGLSYVPEEIGTSTYFIHLKQQTFKRPFVLVLETADNSKNSGAQYQKAKT
ncbi:alpha-L-fucosidase [Mucilaginibacter rubeus]|uniref:alpha-L-fucosidase n=1 Tax=Mucilaginibacter rubeus TaxID=2027860 RepID=A0AAE6JBD0_9SPHI|nr:alpha-L-fucosidase [Mucilaginibacter rubeus]QEM02589.1 alpha-L-fucosidase [Mucilaginibacter rubeus]QTE42067.1 alpha-L-fucosidase [Mucilaginibacter rubeus]QTE48668.1 alpha-L-fucosidase [Mucilaginibacter rubeus]QTE60054.1 alpha-L-fucosidase [Mucilaginibacter rubeus]QTE60479.1 alpha-L-fucosidase [Mucilaginibacter rubeus]